MGFIAPIAPLLLGGAAIGAAAGKSGGSQPPASTATPQAPVPMNNPESIAASLDSQRSKLRRHSFTNTIFAGGMQNPYGNGSNKLGA
jgi:hypothetical protein